MATGADACVAADCELFSGRADNPAELANGGPVTGGVECAGAGAVIVDGNI